MKPEFTTLCRYAAPALLAGFALGAVGCSDSVGGENGSGTGGSDVAGSGDGDGDGGGDTTIQPTSIDALDLLLVVDGSGSMADKQGFLAQTLRPFLERIRSPRCVDANHAVVSNQPAPGAVCPDGSVREYTPDVTVHIGVISSNLGSGDAAVCSAFEGRNNDDAGHLVWRSTPGTPNNDLITYNGQGFFAWDPGGRLTPVPGSNDFDTLMGGVESAIEGVGELGCGFEMPLEAMYRFLNEPDPRDAEDDVDQLLLDQRDAFLRDDSVLQIILLSDENDSSFQNNPVGGLAMIPDGERLPRARSECAAGPTSACCASCIEQVPAGCSGDGGCAEPGNVSNLDNFYEGNDRESNLSLRGWNPKQRFGLEFRYPVGRYVEGLQSATLTLADGSTAPNPLFAGPRSAAPVLFTALVGVPWQEVVRKDESGDPDPTLGFQSSAELTASGTWGRIIGDSSANVLPGNPVMIESPLPRPGLSTALGSSPINGQEFETNYQDLQYACVFDLPQELQQDCATTEANCDCQVDEEGVPFNPGKPVCSDDSPSVQVRAKAYPGLRQLEVARALGDRASVLSICGLSLQPDEESPGPVGTFIMQLGLEQVAEQVATVMSGAE